MYHLMLALRRVAYDNCVQSKLFTRTVGYWCMKMVVLNCTCIVDGLEPP